MTRHTGPPAAVDRHAQMANWDWAKQYTKRWERSVLRTKYLDPDHPQLDKYSWQCASFLAELGSLSLLRRRYGEARAWFDIALRGTLVSIADQVARIPGFPDRQPGLKGTGLLGDSVPNAVALARLTYREVPLSFRQEPFLTASRWILEKVRDEANQILSKPPSLNLGPSTNGLGYRFFDDSLYPALVIQDAELLRQNLELLTKLEAWHAAVKGGLEAFWNRGGWFPARAATARAMIAGDGRAFVEALGKEVGPMTSWDASDKFRMVSDWKYLWIYAEAWRRCGPLPSEPVNHVPVGFNPDMLWDSPMQRPLVPGSA